jgi:hypothetical protein
MGSPEIQTIPTSRTPTPRTGEDRRIASALLAFIIVVILAGFAKNFYLRAWLGSRVLIPTAWLHGFVMSAWLTLFAIQVVFVSRRRIDLHRKLGIFSAAFAPVVVIIGLLTIIVRARIAIPGASLTQYAMLFVAFDGVSLLLFGALVATAVRCRGRPAVHRRLMTMAMVSLLPPAFGRLVAYATHQHIEVTVLVLMSLTVLVFIAVDSTRSGCVHRAFVIPGTLIVLVNVATYIAQSVT